MLDRVTAPRDYPVQLRAAAGQRIPAVVVGGADNGGGLGLVRSLGRGNVLGLIQDR